MKTALVHDWLVGIGGGEKALQAVATLYPGKIYTLVKQPRRLKTTFFENQEIETSFLQKIPFSPSLYRYLLPLFPLAIEQFDLSEYDLVLSSSHAVAKGVLTHPRQLHICYCYTPMRYAWDLYHCYLKEIHGLKKIMAKWTLHRLRNWDVASSHRVDHFIADSYYIAARIKKYYRRESAVIYPPVATHQFSINPKKDSYYFTYSRMVPYKKMDLLVEAFSQLSDKKLIVIGDGPEFDKIKKKAAKNVELLGYQSDTVIKDYLSKAKAFLYAAEEDFGIVIVEAQAAGIPVIAYGKGGALETVIADKTGLFFSEQTPHSIIEAIKEFEGKQDIFDPQVIKRHAETFSQQRFDREFRAFVKEKLEEFFTKR